MGLSNEKRERFCAEYLANGNATKAAIKAGYSERTAAAQGSRLLKDVKIRARIKELGEQIKGDRLADAREVMEYLTGVMRGGMPADRLQFKAMELLAKRYGLLSGNAIEAGNGSPVLIIDDIPEVPHE